MLLTGFLVLLGTACLLAWRLGGAPERIVAGLFVLAWAASFVLTTPAAQRYTQMEAALLSIDALLMIALFVVAIRANRRWPMLLTSLQAMIVLTHLAKLADPLLIRRAYAIMMLIWPFVQVSILILGTALHARRVRRSGPVPSWSISSRRAR